MKPPAYSRAVIERAIAIADSCARSDIESCTTPALHKPGEPFKWWDLDSADDMDSEGLAESVTYLESRGLLVRHDEHPNYVCFEDASA